MGEEIRFTEAVVTELAYSFNNNELQMIRGAIIKVINGYEIREKNLNELVPADDYNNLMMRKFLMKRRLDGIAEKTIDHYKREAINFLAAVNKRAIDVTSEDVEFYLLSYKATHQITNTSYNNLICYIRNFFNYLEDEEIIKRNPFKKIRKLKKDTIPEPAITKSEEEKLYLSCRNLRDRALLEYFFATGCRVSEVCDAKLSDIDFFEKKVQVIGKGSKFRYTFISDKAIIHLKRYLEERPVQSEYVFTMIRKPYGQLAPAGIESIVKDIAKKAGVSNIHPHRIRATFCTRLIDMGMSLHKVKEIMGHDSIETTMLYYRGTNTAVAKNEYEKFM